MAVNQKQQIEQAYPVQRRGDLSIKRFIAYLAASKVDGTLPTYSTNPDDIDDIFDEFKEFANGFSDTQAMSVFVLNLWAIFQEIENVTNSGSVIAGTADDPNTASITPANLNNGAIYYREDSPANFSMWVWSVTNQNWTAVLDYSQPEMELGV